LVNFEQLFFIYHEYQKAVFAYTSLLLGCVVRVSVLFPPTVYFGEIFFQFVTKYNVLVSQQ